MTGRVCSSFEAGDLDDQLHRRGGRRYGARHPVSTAWTAPRSPGRARARPPSRPRRVRRRPRRPARARGLRARLPRVRRSATSSSRPTRSTTPTTSCCGAATCCTARRRCSRGSATRPSTRWRSRSARVLSIFGHVADRMWIALMLGSFLVLVAGVYRLGRIAATPLVGAVAGGAAADPLRLRVPGRPRLHRRLVHGDGRVGRRAGGEPPAPRHAGAAAARRGRPAAPRGLGAGRPVLVLAGLAGDVAGAHPLRRAGRDRPRPVGRAGRRGDRRPAVQPAPHGRPGRGPGPLEAAVPAAGGRPRLLRRPAQAARPGRGVPAWRSAW